jgi:hypothetical protein
MLALRVSFITLVLSAPLGAGDYQNDPSLAPSSEPVQDLGDLVSEALQAGLENALYELDLTMSVDLLVAMEISAQIRKRGEKVDDLKAKQDRSPDGKEKTTPLRKNAVGSEKGTQVYQELIDKGSAAALILQRTKFAEDLRQKGFSDALLTMIYLDVQAGKRENQFHSWSMFKRLSGNQLVKSSSMQRKGDPGVLCFMTTRSLESREKKVAVIAQCSLVFIAVKEAKGSIRTLSFDLYLEELKRRDGAMLAYPWKTKNICYK